MKFFISKIHNLEKMADTIWDKIITKGDFHEPNIRKGIIGIKRSAFW